MAGYDQLNSVAATAAMDERDRGADERSLQKRVAWFTEKWSTQMDLNKRNAAELNADLVIVVQAVHRDAGRDYRELLERMMSAIRLNPTIFKTE